MRIAILSQDASIYSTRRLLEACQKRGHWVKVVDFLRCSFTLHPKQVQIWYQGKLLPPFDAVIPRIGPAKTQYGVALLRQFELNQIPVFNSASSLTCARNKLQCYQALAEAGLPFPMTGFAYSPKDSDTLLSAMGNPPVLLKLLQGSHGIGVVLADNTKTARSLFETLRSLDADLLVQQFIQEASGVDLRCLVLRDRVIAAIQRKGPPGEFRANLHRGAKAVVIHPTPEECDLAVRAAQAIGLQLAGVDLLRTHEGPMLIEVNASPGLEGIEKTTKRDLAGAIISEVERWVTT